MKILLLFSILIVLVVSNPCFTGFSYAEYAVFPQYLANDSITTVSAFVGSERAMSFATTLFKTYNNNPPDYTNTPLLLRPEVAQKFFYLNAKIIQICNWTAAECRYDKVFTTPIDIAIPSLSAVDANKIPASYYFQRQNTMCAQKNNTQYSLSALPEPNCVVFFNSGGYFQICDDNLPLSTSEWIYGNFRFRVSNGSNIDHWKFNNTAIKIQTGLFKSSHPTAPFVNVQNANSKTSAATPLIGDVFVLFF